MRPTLEPGDRLLLLRSPRARPGDLVVVPDPRHPGRLVVKRVVATSSAGVTVEGDNPAASTDSRQFGPVPRVSVRGRVVYRYFPDDRRGRLKGPGSPLKGPLGPCSPLKGPLGPGLGPLVP